MFQEKLIIIDSSWLPRKYTARICVLCKYWQQNHLVTPTIQGQENRKRAHGTNAQWLKSTGRKQHKFGDQRNQSLMKHMTDQWAIQTEVNQGGGKITTNGRWEWNVGGQEVKWTEVKRENPQELEMTGAELQEIPTTKAGSWQTRKEGRPRKLRVKRIESIFNGRLNHGKGSK